MTETRVTKEQLLGQLNVDFELMVEKIVDSINKADYGSIIADTEEPVRDANAEFRKQAYQKALNLLNEQDFSPSQDDASHEVEEQG